MPICVYIYKTGTVKQTCFNAVCRKAYLHVWALQMSNNNILGRSAGSSRRVAVSSSRDAFGGSESDPYRARTTDASPGAHRISSGRRSSPVESSDPSRRHTSQSRNYETTLKGIEGLHLDNEERVHY